MKKIKTWEWDWCFIIVVCCALTTSALLIFCSINKAEAALFRPGKVFPLWRDRPGYEPSQVNPKPIPPPIIDPSLIPAPVPPITQLQPVPQISKEEIVKEVVEAIVALEQDITPVTPVIPESKVPPWLPLGGIAGGGIITLLGFARKGLSQIRGG